MALNVATLKTRSLTAVVFVAVMLAGLLWNFWSFLILFTIIHFGCWYEFVKLVKQIYGSKYLPYCLFGLLYITMPILMMIDLRLSEVSWVIAKWSYYDRSWLYPCLIVFSIWINDTMAYIVGSLIGKTPLSKISPKKTWEGTVGGVILSVFVIVLVYRFTHPSNFINNNFFEGIMANKKWFIIPLLSSIFGTIGDLFESKLKRMAGVKDSGSIMPGHGGFLDRFDSLLFAAPAVWIYVKLFM